MATDMTEIELKQWKELNYVILNGLDIKIVKLTYVNLMQTKECLDYNKVASRI